MHHRFPVRGIYGPVKPKLIGGGAAMAVPITSAELAIDRQLEGLRELAFQVEPIRRLLDTGPPE